MRWLVGFAALSLAVPAWAQDLTFSAKVDKTSATVGEPITLTVTLSGDAAGVKMPALQLPDGFTVAAQSQSTSFHLRAGATERALSFVYVLVARQGGTFQLGPFEVVHEQQTIKTEPITITVEKPAVPPQLKSPGGRYSL